ncbi:hypothetical protein IWW56_003075 [Coemansia sp. RSA 2131]|nr:hypothetical protein IWW56_003075 [Coemansia sp. RSA 2131]
MTAASKNESDADSSADAIVTACGYLTAQANLEREAAEVLSGKFDECTFDQGYVHQPLYACLTCTRPPEKYCQDGILNNVEQPSEPAGMCYSCSIECHTGHHIVELFTKRHFRCDCGTQRLLPQASEGSSGQCCQLKKLRTGLRNINNSGNTYSHNFWGFYCRCDKFYDASTESGEMIQCFVCNDWFHDACIGKVPDEESYSDYICRECVDKHAILRYISTNNMICGTVVDGKVTHIEANSAIYDASTYPAPVEKDDTEEPAKKKTRATGCRQRQDSDVVDAKQPFDLFMVDGWKEHVCTCIDCMREIECSNLEFLVKEEDVVEPEEDESRSESLYESALRQLRTMDRAQAVDAAAAYHTLSSRLKDYLRPFAASGKVVTNQDIHTFFEQHDKNNL